MLKETAYGQELRGLGFVLFNDPSFFVFEVDGVSVAPIGCVFARTTSPDHLTVVQDTNGYIYYAHALIPIQHLRGKDVTRHIAVKVGSESYRRPGRVYIPDTDYKPRAVVRPAASRCTMRVVRRTCTRRLL